MVQTQTNPTRTTRNSQCAGLAAQPRSSLTPARRTTTTFGTSARVVIAFCPIGSGAESISSAPKQCETRKTSENIEILDEDCTITPLDYVDENQDDLEQPPNPDPEDGDGGDGGDPPDDPGNDEPDNDEPPNEGERFLQVMSDLAAGIHTMCQPQPATRPEKVKVREPDTFDGADPQKLRDFLISCNLHFHDRPHVFSSDEKKILFILSYLKGAAINWFEPGLMDPTNSTHWMWDFPIFINELEANFGPHNPVGDAEKALNELSMKENSRIVKYNVEFWKLASKLDWNESALCARYFHGLLLRLCTEVLRGGKPTTLAALHLKAQDTDEIYWMMKEEANHESKAPVKKDHKSSNSNHNSKPANNDASSSANPSKPNSSSNKSNMKNSKEKPKDYTKVGKNGKLTNEEHKCRMREGLCLYCGEKGHVAHDCPKCKAVKGRAANVASNESKSDSADSKK